MPKLNCWQFKKCGRETGGGKAVELGVCPATTTRQLDGVHDGENAGRSCWIVAGTFCGGQVQGTFAKKFQNCEQCEFYQSVKKEEGARFKMSITLLAQLRS